MLERGARWSRVEWGAQHSAYFPLVGRLVGPQPAVQSNTGHQTTTQCSYNFSPLLQHYHTLSNLSNPSNRSLHHPVLPGLCCRSSSVAVNLVIRPDTTARPRLSPACWRSHFQPGFRQSSDSVLQFVVLIVVARHSLPSSQHLSHCQLVSSLPVKSIYKK